MKPLLTGAFMFYLSVAIAQTVSAQQPVEEQFRTNYWWWLLGVALVIAAGVIVYMLIKKDPKKDVVR